MRNYTGELRGILEIYAEEIEAARKKRKPTSGLLGFGPKPSDDPCHEKVDESVKALLEQLAEESDAELTGQVVSDLFHAEAERAWPTDAGLMMIALQRHTLPLLPKISPKKRQELHAWYEQRYPRYQRLPLQKEILKLLKE